MRALQTICVFAALAVVAPRTARAGQLGERHAGAATTIQSSTTIASTSDSAAAPAMTATAGTPQTATIGALFSSPLQVTVQDASGNGVSGVTVVFAVVQISNASATFPEYDTVVTNAAGQASVQVRANASAGAFSVTATAQPAAICVPNPPLCFLPPISSVPPPVRFNLTNTALPSMFIPALASGSATELGIAWTNPTALAVTLTLTAYSYNGNPIAGSGIQNPVQIVVPPYSQVAKQATEIFGVGIAGASGWINLVRSDPANGGGFFLLFDSALQTVDGGAFVRVPSAALLFPEVNNAAILHVVNTAIQPAAVAIDVYDDNGNDLGSAAIALAAMGGWTGHITDLLPALGSAVEGYATVHAPIANLPGSALPELAGMASYQSGGDDAIVMAQNDLSLVSNGDAIQVAIGNGYASRLKLVNPWPAPQYVSLVYAFSVVGETMGYSCQTWAIIPAYGRLDRAIDELFGVSQLQVVENGEFTPLGDRPTSGLLEVGAYDYGMISSTPGVQGFVEIAQNGGLQLTAEPLSAETGTDLLFSQVAQGGDYWTGLALFNPSETAATVTIEVDSATGSTLAKTTVTLAKGQQFVKLLSDLFPAIQNQFGGSVHVTASSAILGFQLYGSGSSGGGSFLAFVPPGND